MPTPPATINAPVVVLVDSASLTIDKVPFTVPVVIVTRSKVILVNVCDQYLKPSVPPVNTELSTAGNPKSGSAWLTSK